MKQKPMVILTGPTAVGKSALSVALAQKIGGSVISADSMQVYQYMDIGSAKITPKEMEGIRHDLVDVLNPKEEFHVVRFQQMAKDALEQIYAANKIPVIVGGTGFYIQALLYDIDFTEQECDSEYRKHLELIAKERGPKALHQMLAAVDLQSSEEIHPNNVRRVIRALEFYRQSGEKISEHNKKEHAKQSPYNFAYFVLNEDRAKLYERIDKRVDTMIESGLIEEVKALRQMGCTRDMVSMQGLGYKEILAYLEGQSSLEDAVCKIKLETRHFAKRQLTWFKRERDVIWLTKENYANDSGLILDKMLTILEEKNIICAS